MIYEVREIPFAPGYFVSTKGEVFTERRKGLRFAIGPRKLKKISFDKDGYPMVGFRPNGSRTMTFTVHRIVATVFLGQKPTPEHEVRHLDGNKLNRDVSNLAWGTSQDNIDDCARHGTRARGERSGGAKLTEDRVRSIRADRRTQAKIAMEHGVSRALIGLVQQRKVWTHVS